MVNKKLIKSKLRKMIPGSYIRYHFPKPFSKKLTYINGKIKSVTSRNIYVDCLYKKNNIKYKALLVIPITNNILLNNIKFYNK